MKTYARTGLYTALAFVAGLLSGCVDKNAEKSIYSGQLGPLNVELTQVKDDFVVYDGYNLRIESKDDGHFVNYWSYCSPTEDKWYRSKLRTFLGKTTTADNSLITKVISIIESEKQVTPRDSTDLVELFTQVIL